MLSSWNDDYKWYRSLGSYTEMLDYAMYIVAKYWESTPFMPLVSCLDVRPGLYVSEADANV